eukprot:TRINITY_DN4418_c0_g1_i1.p1 TRINITY_DN4418_c0_g1~~TRINITY_DN4418_c0_g1_i1.p1  ORF type:complete len:478 (+),score=137.09 TRINITY_DN4418_c0_g1_i1:176-1435(+)
MALAGLYGLVLQLIQLVKEKIFERIVVSVEVKSTDESFEWLLRWLYDNKLTTHTKNLTAFTYRGTHAHNREGSTNNKPTLLFTPGQGLHFFFYKGTLVWLKRQKETANTTSISFQNKEKETIQLSTLTRTADTLKELLKEAMDHGLSEEIGTVSIFVPDNHQMTMWLKALNKPKRSLRSVVLDNKLSEMTVKDVKTFLSSSEWYQSRGLPHRRGYLFYGKPGCGKSSFLFAIASELDLNICCLSLNEDNLTDAKLASLMRQCPARSAILLEDVDCVFVSREATKDNKSKVTFSGLLNAIDGVAAQEGRLVFLTTNHKEKLSSALIRPGRVDVQVQFNNATKYQIRELFNIFFPGQPTALVDEFVSKVPGGAHSMAKLQGYFLNHRDEPSDAVKNVHELESDEAGAAAAATATTPEADTA